MSKEVKRYDCTNGGATFCQGCYTMTETEYGDYVSAEDYDALAAENAELKQANADLDRLASQTAALNEKAGMRVYELEQENESLRALVADIERVAGPDVPDCIDNDGQPYQSQHLADVIASQQAKP